MTSAATWLLRDSGTVAEHIQMGLGMREEPDSVPAVNHGVVENVNHGRVSPNVDLLVKLPSEDNYLFLNRDVKKATNCSDVVKYFDDVLLRWKTGNPAELLSDLLNDGRAIHVLIPAKELENLFSTPEGKSAEDCRIAHASFVTAPDARLKGPEREISLADLLYAHVQRGIGKKTDENKSTFEAAEAKLVSAKAHLQTSIENVKTDFNTAQSNESVTSEAQWCPFQAEQPLPEVPARHGPKKQVYYMPGFWDKLYLKISVNVVLFVIVVLRLLDAKAELEKKLERYKSKLRAANLLTTNHGLAPPEEFYSVREVPKRRASSPNN